MRKDPNITQCELCQRLAPLTFHHLIPRKVQRRPRFKKQYTHEQLQEGIWLCYPCHRAIHRFHDEMTLGLQLNTKARLLSDPEICRHLSWVKKQKIRN